ncbi:hypothetical protein T01_11079 [Trichinella spiralis]|uniref:Uncharacterized protein n=1 Tax=Trichinella spiralis TaxID=6334 RepID=A0A0V1B5V1_TRISP|nr:hypothetical protein T01_11079 [Trichinella spiralis]
MTNSHVAFPDLYSSAQMVKTLSVERSSATFVDYIGNMDCPEQLRIIHSVWNKRSLYLNAEFTHVACISSIWNILKVFENFASQFIAIPECTENGHPKIARRFKSRQKKHKSCYLSSSIALMPLHQSVVKMTIFHQKQYDTLISCNYKTHKAKTTKRIPQGKCNVSVNSVYHIWKQYCTTIV